MASQLQRTNPLQSRLQSLEQLPDGFQVTVNPFLTMTDLRFRPAALETQEADLRAAVTPFGGAAVDVSGQRVSLTLRGRHVRDVLAKGCALDLHHTVFRPGSSAQTTVGLAGVVLLANDDPGEFTVLVRQSFASYLADWLIDAAEEFRPV